MHFKISSSICFNFGQSEILTSGNGLIISSNFNKVSSSESTTGKLSIKKKDRTNKKGTLVTRLRISFSVSNHVPEFGRDLKGSYLINNNCRLREFILKWS